ncbi:universal stress protein [Streptomyces sp. NPDC059442]|uniref:universal stress protein n=1 Tax=Streptomyces sp. NPDC059442 TaxID=3346830 RepID=UPI0036AB9ED2
MWRPGRRSCAADPPPTPPRPRGPRRGDAPFKEIARALSQHQVSAVPVGPVGRRARRSTLGAHTGSVAHAVLHHSPVPVALVPHD